jgi:hypothetical protein
LVDERLVLPPSSQPLELRVLTRPCMKIEYARVERNGVDLDVGQFRHGPWIIWRDTTVATGDSLRLRVRYHVWMGGSRTIPLAHVQAPLATTLGVRFARAEGQVDFPHMSREDDGWSGRYVATPAFVKVAGFAFDCDRLPPPGDNGGLVYRFTVLVLIMVAWVPTYLAWARRSGDNA